jgi:hemolysin activation/secretion protein
MVGRKTNNLQPKQSRLSLWAAAALLFPWNSAAQVGGVHLLGAGELQPAPTPQISKPPPRAPVQPITPAPQLGVFKLRKIMISGSSVPLAALWAACRPSIGQDVNNADLSLIAQRVGAAETNDGVVIFSVSVPPQKIEHGVLHIRVTEARIVHVEIAGNIGHQKPRLLMAYAKKMLGSKPLRRDVLERYILLMGDMPGAKVGSKFVSVPGHPNEVTLVLGVKETKFFGGFSINNQGTPFLDDTQAVFNVGVNNLFQEGERTQLILGLPLNIRRYQYYGLTDVEPLGGSGMTVSLDAGELVSRPVSGESSGAAQIFGVRLNDPVIRSVHTNVNLSLGLDYLNSNNAFLGFTASDERTRTTRFTVSYNDDKYFTGIDNASASVSEGLDFLGARRASIAYGPPSFTKGDISLERFQVLPENFVLRVAVSGQLASDRLPPSEEFEYGGPDFGQAFYAAELTGDSGIAGLAEISHQIPALYIPAALGGTSLYAAADYGRIWNRDTVYAYPTDRGASFGGGIKFTLFHKFQLQIGAATPIIKPEHLGSSERWRAIVATSGQF